MRTNFRLLCVQRNVLKVKQLFSSIRCICHRVYRLLFRFVPASNVTAVGFIRIIFPVSFAYYTFMPMIIWPVCWGIGRRGLIF